MTNIQTGVACLYLVATQFWRSLFPFYKGFAVWEVNILPKRPKVTPQQGISQRSCTVCSRGRAAAAELTLQAAVNALIFIYG